MRSTNSSRWRSNTSRSNPPSLLAFLDEIERADVSVKRDMEARGDSVRVMTVHAAKGLEAPIVFLPDTCGAPSGAARSQALQARAEPARRADADRLVAAQGERSGRGRARRGGRSRRTRPASTGACSMSP